MKGRAIRREHRSSIIPNLTSKCDEIKMDGEKDRQHSSLSIKKLNRKRRLSETITENIEKQDTEQQEEKGTGSQTGTTVTEEDEKGWLLSEAGSSTGGEDEDEEDEGDAASEDERHFPVVIPDNLRAVLERDYHLINDRNKLLDLPTEKTVLSLLENYVRFFAMRYQARTRGKRRTETKEEDKCFMTLDLCKEVMDGLRICFDYHIKTLLLYAPERRQAERLCTAQPVYAKRESGRSTPTTVTSGGSTAGVSSSLGRSTLHSLPYASLQHPPLQDWTLLPEVHRQPAPPVILYGHIHLLRLFVKLPEILFRMNLSEYKKKVISKHLDLFLEYISTHSKELFLKSHYINNPDL